MSDPRDNVKKLIHSSSEDFWQWWGKSSPPSNRKEIIPLDGPIAPGSGSKSGKRKKKRPKRLDPWKLE